MCAHTSCICLALTHNPDGDVLLQIDEIVVEQCGHKEICDLMLSKAGAERALTIMRDHAASHVRSRANPIADLNIAPPSVKQAALPGKENEGTQEVLLF